MPAKGFTDYSGNKIFIETGSHLGEGIQLAIDAGFERIISIEILKNFYDFCKQRFKGESSVELHLGDSYKLLWEIIKYINDPVTFWLDGHFSVGDKAGSDYLSPLMQELEVIGRHHIKTHTILIDDVSCWNDYDNIFHKGFDNASLELELLHINPSYNITRIDGRELKNDIMVAQIIK